MGVASTAPMGPFADGSISNLAYNISNYLCTNFGAFIKKCTMAAYPLYYYALRSFGMYYNYTTSKNIRPVYYDTTFWDNTACGH